jgi:hypothetical protein
MKFSDHFMSHNPMSSKEHTQPTMHHSVRTSSQHRYPNVQCLSNRNQIKHRGLFAHTQHNSTENFLDPQASSDPEQNLLTVTSLKQAEHMLSQQRHQSTNLSSQQMNSHLISKSNSLSQFAPRDPTVIINTEAFQEMI